MLNAGCLRATRDSRQLQGYTACIDRADALDYKFMNTARLSLSDVCGQIFRGGSE